MKYFNECISWTYSSNRSIWQPIINFFPTSSVFKRVVLWQCFLFIWKGLLYLFFVLKLTQFHIWAFHDFWYPVQLRTDRIPPLICDFKIFSCVCGYSLALIKAIPSSFGDSASNKGPSSFFVHQRATCGGTVILLSQTFQSVQSRHQR